MQILDTKDGAAVNSAATDSVTPRASGADQDHTAAAAHPRDRGLLLVGLFKLSKAIFFGSLAVGALHLTHSNVSDVVLRVVDALRVDPESHFVSLLLNKADLIDVHQLRQFSLFTSSYSVLCLIEGTGLLLEKVWAEYFTIVLTVMGLPWESYELFVRFSAFKVGLLLLNVVVLLYLLWLLKRKREHQRPLADGLPGASQS